MQSDEQGLIQAFKEMNQNGFDTSKPLKWGFYFIDESKENLKLVFTELKDFGYTLEHLGQTESESDWQLFVTKIEVLLPDKLHRRNIAFNELAVHCKVSSYDGWDVERV